MINGRLTQQIQFILEIDKLKTILRQTRITTNERYENSAEHSWHLAMLALVLHEYANEPIDLFRVLKMVLVHDIVEIDAGDTFFFDTNGNGTKAAREQKAANRLFGLLPADQQTELRGLWEEFEARETADAKFAAAVDRVAPTLLNYVNREESSWHKHNLTFDTVVSRVEYMREGSETLWEIAKMTLEQAVADGYLAK
ncbi:MAG: HD domain-containing protein [Ardenticatenaceae bacterium]|nr:HD domain-containing protein [Ardenticatenaceae bacterium]